MAKLTLNSNLSLLNSPFSSVVREQYLRVPLIKQQLLTETSVLKDLVALSSLKPDECMRRMRELPRLLKDVQGHLPRSWGPELLLLDLRLPWELECVCPAEAKQPWEVDWGQYTLGGKPPPTILTLCATGARAFSAAMELRVAGIMTAQFAQL